MIRFEFQGSLVTTIRKEMLRRRGAINQATAYRAPELNIKISRLLDDLQNWTETMIN